MKRTFVIVGALFTGLAMGMASAKLPAPSEEQKATAEAAKMKAAEAAKKEGELLGKAQDRAVERYKKAQVTKTSGTNKK